MSVTPEHAESITNIVGLCGALSYIRFQAYAIIRKNQNPDLLDLPYVASLLFSIGFFIFFGYNYGLLSAIKVLFLSFLVGAIGFIITPSFFTGLIAGFGLLIATPIIVYFLLKLSNII